MAVLLISGVASSQSFLYIGGIIPDVTMIIAFRFLSDRGIGIPDMFKNLPSGLAKVQQILSRNVIIVAVAYPIWTGVPNISASDLRISCFM